MDAQYSLGSPLQSLPHAPQLGRSASETHEPPQQALPVQTTPGGPPTQQPAPFARAGCVHTPPLQTSFVQSLPSPAQTPVRGECVQPVVPQASLVHGLPSSQPAATQVPAQHISAIATHVLARTQAVPAQAAISHGPSAHDAGVQVGYWQPAIESQVPPGAAAHAASLGACAQPLTPQLSRVHETPSSQPAGSQRPAQHASPAGHVLACSHVAPTHTASRHSDGEATHVMTSQTVYWQPRLGSGSQTPPGPAVQSPSSGAWAQPAGPHESAVQGTPSSQSAGTHAEPPSTPTPASAEVATHPSSTSHVSPAAHLESTGSDRHTPAMHRGLVQAARAGHSASAAQVVHASSSTRQQRPSTHTDASGSPPAVGHAPQPRRVMTTVTAVSCGARTLVSRSATSAPSESKSVVRSRNEAGTAEISAIRTPRKYRSEAPAPPTTAKRGGSVAATPPGGSRRTRTLPNSRPGTKSVRRSTTRSVVSALQPTAAAASASTVKARTMGALGGYSPGDAGHNGARSAR